MSGSFRPAHWVSRFFGSLRRGAPSDDGAEWAQGFLSEREQVLLARMSNPDRRHAIGVARAVDAALAADDAPRLDAERRRVVVAAALLHDVGKTVAGLGTYGRVVATLSGLVASDFAEAWQQSSGFTRKVGLYLRYPVLGAELLEINESDPWVVAWAREHHEPESAWTIPVEVGRVLVGADG